MTAASMPPLRRPAEGSRRVRQNAYVRGGLPLSSSTSPIGRGAVFHVPLVPGEEHAFKVVDPAISGDRPSGMGRSSTRARSLPGPTDRERMQPQLQPLRTEPGGRQRPDRGNEEPYVERARKAYDLVDGLSHRSEDRAHVSVALAFLSPLAVSPRAGPGVAVLVKVLAR
jgi:hypothetical protein